MTKSRFALLSLLLAGITACSKKESSPSLPHETQNVPHQTSGWTGGIRGLPGVDMDQALRTLFSGPSRTFSAPSDDKSAHSEIQKVIDVFNQVQSLPPGKALGELYQVIAQHILGSFDSDRGYFRVADQLHEIRIKIRTVKSPLTARAILLLALLSDEALYVASLKAPHARAVWTWSPAPRNCQADSLKGCVEAGDILLSRSTAFSASLFSMRSEERDVVSHASIAYQDSGGGIRLVEADVNGKHRYDLKNLDQLPKSSGFRYLESPKNDRPRRAAQSMGLGADRLNFNFALKPECRADAAFCTEWIHCQFNQVGLGESENPYPRSGWVQPTNREQEDIDRFANKVFRLYWGAIPFPGDIEFNARYAPVFYRTRLSLLPALRIHRAIMNAWIRLLRDRPAIRDRVLEVIQQGSQSPELIQRWIGLYAGARRKDSLRDFERTQSAHGTQVGSNAIFFFSLFEFILIPKISDELIRETGSRPIGLIDLENRALLKLEKRLGEWMK